MATKIEMTEKAIKSLELRVWILSLPRIRATITYDKGISSKDADNK